MICFLVVNIQAIMGGIHPSDYGWYITSGY